MGIGRMPAQALAVLHEAICLDGGRVHSLLDSQKGVEDQHAELVDENYTCTGLPVLADRTKEVLGSGASIAILTYRQSDRITFT